MAALVFPLAFRVGGLFHRLLLVVGWVPRARALPLPVVWVRLRRSGQRGLPAVSADQELPMICCPACGHVTRTQADRSWAGWPRGLARVQSTAEDALAEVVRPNRDLAKLGRRLRGKSE
jgi:hypothetical protein